LDEDWDKKSPKDIIHAIGMSYKLTTNKSSRKKSTKYLVKKALRKAFEIILDGDYKSVSIPVMCSRKKYGIKPEESLNIILEILKKLPDASMEEAIICFDSPRTQKLLETLK